jgi:hypothetical protein
MSSESRRRRVDFGAGRRRPFPRWARLVVAFVAMALLLTSRGSAHNMSVPTGAQAELLAKLAGFDRNFAARAGGKAVIVLAAMPGDTESMSAALEMKASLSRLPKVGELPHEEHIIVHSNAAALVDVVRTKRAAIVYFGPGFEKQVPAIRDAFSSVNVLTVGGVPSYVQGGVVLGFDLVSGRPKLLVHLVQARKQQVSFPASVLNLMKVYQ